MTINTFPLAGGLIGVERETLRTTADARLASTRHPEILGNVYTHPNITIDYSEALLEFVTDAHPSVQKTYQQLLHLHQYTAQHLQQEQLWSVSMPCRLPENPEHIEIGYFGSSNGGKKSRLYRVGLAYRYGRAMQMIAGVHFNYSPPAALWQALADACGVALSVDWQNERYMGMLRNIQRHGWLICHLFGASSATDISFQPAQNVLTRRHDRTLNWKNATSLRMSQLGYQNKIDFHISFNNLKDYVRDLSAAVLTPAPVYEYLGLKDPAGHYRQMNTNILQIENEYYSSARPKQPIKEHEQPAVALNQRGIAYIELRLLDINPYDAAGVSVAQMRFLECFLLWCLLHDASYFTTADYNEANHNRLRTACCGLSPAFTLFNNKRQITARDWAAEILDQLLPIAENLDRNSGATAYQQAVQTQIQANRGEILRLPERVQEDLAQQEFIDWALSLQNQHRAILQTPLPETVAQQLTQQSEQSRQRFLELEAQAAHEMPFEQYLAQYYAALNQLLSA